MRVVQSTYQSSDYGRGRVCKLFVRIASMWISALSENYLGAGRLQPLLDTNLAIYLGNISSIAVYSSSGSYLFSEHDDFL